MALTRCPPSLTQEVDLLGRAAGLAVVAVHGDFDEEVGLEHEEAYRMLVWLQKQGSEGQER